MTALLSARDLRVEFRGRRRSRTRAVDGVNLDIAEGEIVALAGESGCGKTTLARTLIGLEKPHSGTVHYGGVGVDYSSRGLKRHRRHVQLVLQDPTAALNPRHTVYESVAEGLRIHSIAGDERDLVTEALSHAGLRPPHRYFHSYPHQLSGGQRQRVAIAGALALRPKLIIADEPVASLDASVRGEILALLLRLRDDTGLAALVVTHDLGLAWNIADRLAVMYAGRLVEHGPADTVLTRPAHPYTRALVSVLPEQVVGTPQVLRGEAPDTAAPPPGCRFHPRCPALADGRAEPVAADCHSRDLPVLAADGAGVACHLYPDGRHPGRTGPLSR